MCLILKRSFLVRICQPPIFPPFKALLKPLTKLYKPSQGFISGSLRYTTLPYYRALASNQIRGIRKGQKTLIQWKTGNENWKTYPGCLRFFVACGVAPVSLLGSFTECTRETLSLRARPRNSPFTLKNKQIRRLSRSLLVAGWFGVGLSGKARVTILKTDLTKTGNFA